MILTHPSEVQALLDRLGVRPNRTLGQNFLIDANILRIMLEAAQLHPRDTVLEVGAGLGVLTEWLVSCARTVVAVEKDPRLIGYLRERFRDIRNVTLLEADIMDLPLDKILAQPIHKMVSNLPYSIASRLLFAIAESPHAPERITVTVQKEVADRVAARPGSPNYGLLSVALQLRYVPEKLREVSPTCFLPSPEVRSSLLCLMRREQPLAAKDPELLRRLLKSAFEQRRKQIKGLLERQFRMDGEAVAAVLQQVGISPAWRPERIAAEQWVELANMLTARPPPPCSPNGRQGA